MLHTAIAERSGLTATDTKTIDTLIRLGRVTAGEVAGYTGLATASVTSLIDRLERKGLVRRGAGGRGRRAALWGGGWGGAARGADAIVATRAGVVNVPER